MRRSNTRFISGTIAVLACCVTAASLLSACRASDEDKPVITTEIKSITVMSAEENSENIWYINWPGCYVAGNEYVNFEDKALELNEDETEFILSYMNSFPSAPENADESECICRIWVTIVDEKSNCSLIGSVYGDYPEGTDRFCEIINRVCGGDKEFLCANGNMQEMTDEYFTAITGYTDERIKGGTIRDVVEHLCLDNTIQCYHYFLKNWYYEYILDNYELCRMLPYEVYSVPSSDEECRAYAEELAKALGATGGVTKGSSDFAGQEWYEINGYKDTVIRIYRTDIVSKDIRNSGGLVDTYYCSFTIYEPVDMGELEGGNRFDFVYSNDHKFAVCVAHEYGDGGQKETLYEAGLVVLTLD